MAYIKWSIDVIYYHYVFNCLNVVLPDIVLTSLCTAAIKTLSFDEHSALMSSIYLESPEFRKYKVAALTKEAMRYIGLLQISYNTIKN